MDLSKLFKNKDLLFENVSRTDEPRGRRVRAESADFPPRPPGEGVRSSTTAGRGTDVSRLAPPADAGAAKRWRFGRDVVIFVAHVHGISQRELADVFDLPQSRISAIVRGIVERMGRSARPSIPADRIADLSRLVPPPDGCAAKRWRFRQSRVIFVAHSHGVSQRQLADVFDLPQSRISAIVRGIIQQMDSDPTSNSRTRPTEGRER